MSIVTLTLILLSAALHASWNVLLKTREDPTAATVSLAAIACIIALCFGLPNISSLHSISAVIGTVLAGVFAGGALFAIGKAFEGGKLGVLYAISRSSSILFLWPASALIFHERVHSLDIVGASCITFSLTWLGSDNSNRSDLAHMAWALGSGLCIVGYNLCYKWTLAKGVNPFALLGCSDLVRVFISYRLISGDRFSRVKSEASFNFGKLFLMALMSFGGFSIFLFALKSEGAAHLTTLRNLSILFAMLGSHRIGEKLSFRSVFSVLLSILGTILIGVKK